MFKFLVKNIMPAQWTALSFLLFDCSWKKYFYNGIRNLYICRCCHPCILKILKYQLQDITSSVKYLILSFFLSVNISLSIIEANSILLYTIELDYKLSFKFCKSKSCIVYCKVNGCLLRCLCCMSSKINWMAEYALQMVMDRF